MRILFIGDVVGRPGRAILKPAIRSLREQHAPDLVIANGENASGGIGMTSAAAREILKAGCDVITGGNHTWDKREVIPFMQERDDILRPANYPEGTPGRGVCVVRGRNGADVAVINLMGRVFMEPIDDPFRTVDRLLADLRGRARVILVDFHAEATSEKIAMGWYLDGRATAVIGTHTHVTTADERILPGGTAYITDVGMTGPYDSVIGVSKSDVVERFLSQRPVRFRVADGDVRLAAVLVDADPDNGRARAIRRLAVHSRPQA